MMLPSSQCTSSHLALLGQHSTNSYCFQIDNKAGNEFASQKKKGKEKKNVQAVRSEEHTDSMSATQSFFWV
jgi:hypothetical protein